MTKSNIDPHQEETMSKSELEQYFTATQERFDNLEGRFDKLEEKYDGKFSELEIRMGRIENIAFAILEVVRGNDAKLSDFERRLLQLEKRPV